MRVQIKRLKDRQASHKPLDKMITVFGGGHVAHAITSVRHRRREVVFYCILNLLGTNRKHSNFDLHHVNLDLSEDALV